MKIRLDDGIVIDTKQFKYTVGDVDRHGNVRIYVRRDGRKVRLRNITSLENFAAGYRKALEEGPKTLEKPGRPPVRRDSLRWLVEMYFNCAEFQELGKSTQYARRGILDTICENYGTWPYKLMESGHVRTRVRDVKIEFPEAANNRVKAIRQVFKWAVEVGYADTNPARDIPRLKSNNPDGYHTWSVDEVHQFEDHHPIGTTARLAMALGLFTGVRRSDAVRLGRQVERDGLLLFHRAKKQGEKFEASRDFDLAGIAGNSRRNEVRPSYIFSDAVWQTF